MGWLSRIFKGSNHEVSEGDYNWRYQNTLLMHCEFAHVGCYGVSSFTLVLRVLICFFLFMFFIYCVFDFKLK